MSDISTKLTYLNTTKNQLKDQINYGLPTEKQITSSTTFRNYVGSIFEAFLEALRTPDTLFNNLPKTSGSGSQITLNGTANAPMRITLNPTAISQDGTPTPSSPQDIHTISGNNSVVVEGKNILELPDGTFTNRGITSTISNGVISCSGTATGNYAELYSGNTTNLVSGTYTFSIKEAISVPIRFRYFVNGTRKDAIINANETSVSFTASDNIEDGFVYLPTLTSGTTYNLTIYPMIEKGSTATPYTPYVSQTNPINLGEYELGTIGNYSNEFVRSDGENSFSTDYKTTDTFTTYTKIDNNSYSYTCSGTWKGVTFVVPCEENTDYFINYNEHNPNNRGTYCEVKGGQTNTSLMARYHDYLITFNSGENTSLKITITNGTASDNTSGTITEIMLNKGTTALPYVPYEKGWYYKQGIGKVVLDGTESWSKSSSTDIDKFILATTLYLNDSNSKCNKFTKASYDSNTIGTWLNVNGTQLRFNYSTYGTTTLEQWKTWLSNNNVICYQPLATPTYTKITGELAEQLEQVYKSMLSYDGTTNISQVNNDLPFELVGSAITK